MAEVPAPQNMGRPDAYIQKTFQPEHLGVAETVNLVREMTGLEKFVVDEQAGTIEVEALPETLSEIEFLLRVFDNQQPDTASPWEVRVFHLDHLSSREAATLLRSKLLVLELAQNKALDRVAVRDSAERLDATAQSCSAAASCRERARFPKSRSRWAIVSHSVFPHAQNESIS